jgi:hypothetical protein
MSQSDHEHRDVDSARRSVPLDQIRAAERSGDAGGATGSAGTLPPDERGLSTRDDHARPRASFSDPIVAGEGATGDAASVAGAAPDTSASDSAPEWMSHPVRQGGGGASGDESSRRDSRE